MERVDSSEKHVNSNQATDSLLPKAAIIHIHGSGNSRVLIQIFWQE
jgi:hypothetical protein